MGLIWEYFFMAPLIGAISGFLSAMPLGPINLWLAHHISDQPHKKNHGFVFGVILADLIYAGLAFWGYFHLIYESNYHQALAFGAGVVLIVFGIHLFLPKKVRKTDSQEAPNHKPSGFLKDSLMGLMMCGANPGFGFFWLFVATWLAGLGFEMSAPVPLLIMLGIILGDLAWFALFSVFVKRTSHRLNKNWMGYLRHALAGLLILSGVYGIASRVAS